MALAGGGCRALSEPVQVRLGSDADQPYVLDLGLRTLAASASEFRDVAAGGLETSYQRLLAYLFNQSHVVLIAQAAQERVGFLVMLDELPDEVGATPQAFIAYMAVEPHARRVHVGRALLERAEQIAREKGLPAMALMVTETNQAARALYEQAGFATERRLLAKRL